MSDWWEKGYPGGPMVDAPALPRQLYPPDSSRQGYQPSSDGPDVVAVKRTVSRAGRWPWQTFDDTYGNGFAHGTSGNVAQTGLAGVQRQQHIQDTGYVGQETYNLLRSIRIPDGLPHAGEPAMDATAQLLLWDAWELFHPPATAAVGKLTRKAMPSPNYSSRSGAAVRLIVIHTAEGATTIESLGNFFASSSAGVSSHVGVDDKPGVIGEYVQRAGKAWTAANANPVAVQAELCAFAAWSLDEWKSHPHMLENCARWIAEEAAAFSLPLVKLSASQAQGSGRGVCQHADLGSWGGGHWDCGGSFPIDDVLDRAKELTL